MTEMTTIYNEYLKTANEARYFVEKSHNGWHVINIDGFYASNVPFTTKKEALVYALELRIIR